MEGMSPRTATRVFGTCGRARTIIVNTLPGSLTSWKPATVDFRDAEPVEWFVSVPPTQELLFFAPTLCCGVPLTSVTSAAAIIICDSDL
jgi:hypothetical protein